MVTQNYSITQLARKNNVSESVVRRLIDTGDLRAHRVGRQWRIFSSDFEDYLKRTANQPAAGLRVALDINVPCFKCGAPTAGKAHLLDSNRALCGACQASAAAPVCDVEGLRA